MSNKELKELMSIICEGQDSEQRRKVENFIEYQVQLIDSLDKEIERLNSIIKEVREYVKSMTLYNNNKCDTGMKDYQCTHLLEILDKENDNV